MNFFKAQDKARRQTTRLIILFSLAVLCLIILTNFLFIGTFSLLEGDESLSLLTNISNNYNQDIVIAISIGVSLLIIIGSMYKISALSKGGPAIAELLGGRLISQSTREHSERVLLNVVEEMSIAAGMPIPKVYLLDELGINAFAAGQSHNNSVIGVTQGALDQLSRDELQGVIAHEFSHILNGDMKLNLRLIGILHGILLIGIIGEYALNSMRFSRGKKDGGGAIIVLGIGLMIIGYAGTFFGKWIKASVSRQREFLADASAVQFTRNKDTIGGALKKIGGLEQGSKLETPSASEYSHAYFANGISSFFASMFATHPPLEDRIKQVDPTWNGNFIIPKHVVEKTEEKTDRRASPLSGLGISSPVVLATIDQVIGQIGTINENNIELAQQLILSIPNTLRESSQNPYSARAVLYTLLIREQNDKDKAWSLLDNNADKGIPALTRELYDSSVSLDERLILPLLELCVNSLRELSDKQYKTFKHTVNRIISADRTVDLNEWVIQRLVLEQLDEHFSLRKPLKDKHAYFGAVKNEAEILLSLIAYTEHKDDKNITAKQAFELGINEIGAKAFKMVPKEDISLTNLNESLDQLMQLKPLLKPRILKACAAIIMADGKTTRKGIELFRTVSSSLNCPVPLIEI